MTHRTVVGLDPGAGGGIAYNDPDGGVHAIGMPEDPEEICATARRVFAYGFPVICYVEQVTGFIKPGKTATSCHACGQDKTGQKCPVCGLPIAKLRQPGHTMFNFGFNAGQARGIFIMGGAVIVPVAAKTWQKPLFLPKAKGYSERKRLLADAARRRFPRVHVTLKTADALLLHAYGMLCTGETAAPMPSAGPQSELPLAAETPAAVAVAERAAHAPLDKGFSRYIGKWMNIDCLFEDDPLGATMIRTATPQDLAAYPRK